MITLTLKSIGSAHQIGHKARKHVFGFPKRSYPNQPAQLQTLPRKSKSLDMILSNKQITKAHHPNPGDRFPDNGTNARLVQVSLCKIQGLFKDF